MTDMTGKRREERMIFRHGLYDCGPNGRAHCRICNEVMEFVWRGDRTDGGQRWKIYNCPDCGHEIEHRAVPRRPSPDIIPATRQHIRDDERARQARQLAMTVDVEGDRRMKLRIIDKDLGPRFPFRYNLYVWLGHLAAVLLDPILHPFGYYCDLHTDAIVRRLLWDPKRAEKSNASRDLR